MSDEIRNVSVLVNNSLDTLGYSHEQIMCRKLTYRSLETRLTETNQTLAVILDGLMVDGVATPYESKLRCIYLPNDVICVDEGMDDILGSDKTVFMVENIPEKPGYVTLKLKAFGGETHAAEVRQSMFGMDCQLWSSRFKTILRKRYKKESNSRLIWKHNIGTRVKVSFALKFSYATRQERSEKNSITYGDVDVDKSKHLQYSWAILEPARPSDSQSSHLEWKLNTSGKIEE